jgi:hypothetical protein
MLGDRNDMPKTYTPAVDAYAYSEVKLNPSNYMVYQFGRGFNRHALPNTIDQRLPMHWVCLLAPIL